MTIDDVVLVEFSMDRPDVVLVRLVNEVDLSHARILATAFAGVAALAGTVRGVVLDVSVLEFMDCTALSALLRFKKDCHQAGMRFVVVAPTVPVVQRCFELTRMDEVLDLRPSLGSAMADFDGPTGTDR